MQKAVAEVRAMKTEREKLRLVYDHYTQKVASLTKILEKKRSANPMYVDNPKKVEKMARNERKLKSATDNFQSLSSKCMSNINQLLDSTYTKVAPIIAKTVSLQMSLFTKASKELAVIKDVPQDILDANKRRMISIERERLEQANKQQEHNRLSLQSSAGPRPPEQRSSLNAQSFHSQQAQPAHSQQALPTSQQKQVPQALEEEEDVVFDMKRLDDLDKPAGSAKSKDSWEDIAKPVQSRAAYWDKPADFDASPSTAESFGGFSTGMPRTSAQMPGMNRSQSVAQINTGKSQQESPYNDMGQMAQMQQWMSMMMTNPEAMAQMQHMQTMMMSQMQPSAPPKPALDPNDPFFTIEVDPAAHSGNDFSQKGKDAIFGGFDFSNDSPGLAARTAEGAKAFATRNPFMSTERKEGSSGFFNL
mmetsp:Transcript_11232/g.22097  ORF Transcript_11232/g.22097 Transcript_11232/m.22097 type:complete len:418 (+) Transcript_11232:373-1626(+)